jgi:hypothetical protein
VIELKNKVEQLENQNKKLSDSIKNIEEWNLVNSTIIGIPKERDFKVNEEAEIKFGLFRVGEFRKYNIYKADTEFNKKELLKENWNQAEYYYRYTPKSINENNVKLIFEYDFDGVKYELQGNITLSVIE